jgi:hypothetical protein
MQNGGSCFENQHLVEIRSSLGELTQLEAGPVLDVIHAQLIACGVWFERKGTSWEKNKRRRWFVTEVKSKNGTTG